MCVHCPLLKSKTVQPTMEIFRLLKDFDKSRHAASSTSEMALLESFGGNHDYQNCSALKLTSTVLIFNIASAAMATQKTVIREAKQR